MVRTTCRRGTGSSTSFCNHSAHRSCFFSQDGQKLRPRQENGQSTLVQQVGHQSRAKPCSTSPQRMNPRSTLDAGRSGPCALANRAAPSDRAAIAIGEDARIHFGRSGRRAGLLEVLRDETKERGLPGPPRTINPRPDLHASPTAGGRDRRKSGTGVLGAVLLDTLKRRGFRLLALAGS